MAIEVEIEISNGTKLTLQLVRTEIRVSGPGKTALQIVGPVLSPFLPNSIMVTKDSALLFARSILTELE